MSELDSVSLPITPDYQPEWTARQALRELIANGLDAEKRYCERGMGELSVSHHQIRQELVICNTGVSLPTKSLMLGFSESRQREDAIGQFGEGLLMACLVLARTEGMSIEIETGKHRWLPSLSESPFGVSTLSVRFERLSRESPDVRVRVRGVDRELAEESKKLFLALDDDLDDSSVICPIQGDKSSVLTQPEYAGRIYVRGVYVSSVENVPFGYNLYDADLNRDREIIKSFSLTWELSRVTAAALEKYPEVFVERISHAFAAGQSPIVKHAFHYNASAVDVLANRFIEDHGKRAVPVDSSQNARRADELGQIGVVVPKQYREVLEKKFGPMSDRLNHSARTPLHTYSWRDLSFREKRLLQAFAEVIEATEYIEEGVLDRMVVVDFIDPSILGTHTTDDDVPVRLCRDIIRDPRQLLETWVHEEAHWAGTDRSQVHNDLIQEILSDIACTALGFERSNDRGEHE